MCPAPPPCSSRNKGLDSLITAALDPAPFSAAIRRLQKYFASYVHNCPTPLPTPGLMVTPEIRIQSELYLPVSEISAAFYRLYRSALTYPPILASTPFHNALSWADLFVALPPLVQFSANPAHLLEALLANRSLLTKFLFASFLPTRFYGGFGRYPGQQQCISKWLRSDDRTTIRCLDAACGTGEGTYDLALLLSDQGVAPETADINGWTVEPLEVWAAAERRFPHDPQREVTFREYTSGLTRYNIRFSCADIADAELEKKFDLIICNGLLGGPIIHRKGEVERVVARLADLLTPGGLLLAADHFHGGWKQHCPQSELQAVFERHRLVYVDAGEGIGGRKA